MTVFWTYLLLANDHGKIRHLFCYGQLFFEISKSATSFEFLLKMLFFPYQVPYKILHDCVVCTCQKCVWVWRTQDVHVRQEDLCILIIWPWQALAFFTTTLNFYFVSKNRLVIALEVKIREKYSLSIFYILCLYLYSDGKLRFLTKLANLAK